jgi:hypothetical protein
MSAVAARAAHGAPAAPGTAQDKQACANASEEAQLQRIHGKLRAARAQLLVCSRDVCPVLVKHDCDQWLAEVDSSLPTVVISATDRQGGDVGNVRVLVDGQPFLESLDGKAAAIDAGQHTLRFQHPGDAPTEQQIIVREGEKNRQVSVQFGPAPIPLATPMPLPAPGPAPVEEARSKALPILGFSLLGVGAAALGFATYFEVLQLNNYSTLKHTCSPADACTEAQVNAISNQRLYAGISLGVGIAAAGTGVVLLLTRHRAADATHPPRSSGAWLDVGPRQGGGSAAFHVVF